VTDQPEGPGVALKSAREALNVSVREVADALNLPLHIVEAIEANDYERLPQAVFTRGYLRSYARLLELDSEAIVSSYPEAEQADVTLTTELEVVMPAYEWWRRPPVWLAGAGVAVAVIVLALLVSWLRADGPDESSADEVSDSAQTAQPSPDAESSSEPELDLSDALPPSVDQSPAVLEPIASEAETTARAAEINARADSTGEADLPARVESAAREIATAPAEVTTQVEPGSEPTEAIATAAPTRSADAQPRPAEAEENVPADAALQSTSETVSAPTPAGMRRITPFGDDVLVIGFAEDCWVEIKDSEGAALYGDLNRGGATLRVIGRAPFRILLGYAPGVEMTFNGETVEVSRYTRNNVASITVGG